MRPPPVPVTVLTGFLGAGKTTLLNRLLRHPALSRAAVVVNEFGAVGIDHLLVDAVANDLLVLTTGCICCAARGDLLDALQGLLARRDAGTIGFERIIIETTGLADPGPILDAILLDPALRMACRLDGVVTVVDGSAGTILLQTHEEARRQIVLADVIVLSKLDLARPDDSGPADLEARLRALNPAATIVGGQDLAAVAAAVLAPDRAPAAVPATRHGAHHHHHDGGIEAVCFEAGPVDPACFDAFLERLLGRFGAALLRVKGIVASTLDPDRPTVIHVVGSRLHPARILAAWPGPERGTRLVVILAGRSAEDVRALWDIHFGPPAIDRPDEAGLAAWTDMGPGLF